MINQPSANRYLYKISQPSIQQPLEQFATIKSMLVIAESEEEAIRIHPCSYWSEGAQALRVATGAKLDDKSQQWMLEDVRNGRIGRWELIDQQWSTPINDLVVEQIYMFPQNMVPLTSDEGRLPIIGTECYPVIRTEKLSPVPTNYTGCVLVGRSPDAILYFFRNGVFHRENGPAIYHFKTSEITKNKFYLIGKEFTKEEFDKIEKNSRLCFHEGGYGDECCSGCEIICMGTLNNLGLFKTDLDYHNWYNSK